MTRPPARLSAAVLTGATSGIGEATARRLAVEVDTLVLLGPEPGHAVVPVLNQIATSGPAKLHYIAADFTSLARVVEAAADIRTLLPRIDVLINNAGVPGAPERMITGDGFERTLQVNALAPALLTRLLMPPVSAGGRIVNVGSSAHRVEHFDFDDIDLSADYSSISAYARAKLAMVTWSSLLAQEEAFTPVTVVALCPGLNDTPLSAAMIGHVGRPPSHGAQLVLTASTAAVPSGSYLENGTVVSPSADSLDLGNRVRLTALFRERLSPFVPASGGQLRARGSR